MKNEPYAVALSLAFSLTSALSFSLTMSGLVPAFGAPEVEERSAEKKQSQGKSADSQGAEKKAAESKPAESKSADFRAAEAKESVSGAVDKKDTETRSVDAKADGTKDSGIKIPDKKSAQSMSADTKAAETKDGDKKAAQSKGSELKAAEKAPLAEAKNAKPLIGVNCDVSGEKPKEVGVAAPYLEAISKAGGLPVLLPPMAAEDITKVLPMLDGVMMIGGDDYPPSLYGEKEHASVTLMAKERSDFDMALVKAVLAEKNLPFLGICAGCQALNIGLGGSLIQDIASEKPGSRLLHAGKNGYQSGFNSHPVSFVKGSKLQRLYGKEVITEPTSHHQAVSKPGTGIAVCGSADDGIVEAIEVAGRPFAFGVQFHPERAYDRNKALFEEFISTALARHSARQAAAH